MLTVAINQRYSPEDFETLVQMLVECIKCIYLLQIFNLDEVDCKKCDHSS